MTNHSRDIHHLFEAQVERTPGARAVASAGSSLSYEELNRRANQVASYLSTCGIAGDTIVGFYLEYSLELVVGLLAVLKSGGTFVLLDPSHPQEWQARMLQNTHVQVLITSEKWLADLPSYGGKTICLEREAQTLAQMGQENAGLTGTNNVAAFFATGGRYLILEQQQLSAHLKWLQKRFALSHTDTLLSISSPAEESILFDIFWTLTTGACLLIAQQKWLADSKRAQQLLTAHQVTILHGSVPALRLLAGVSFPATLRQVLASGEIPSRTFFRTFQETFTGEFSYLYGGLEAAYYLEMKATEQPEPSDMQERSLVGHVTSLAVYILNASKQLVPPGGSGEIYVAGTGVARGYLGSPAETEGRFLTDPHTHTHMFKTGLRGRYRNGGKIEVQDVNARQVWIGGYAILLDEVEDALLRKTAVSSSRVIARRNQDGEQELVAYVVTTGQSSPAVWLEQLRTALPDAWMPHVFLSVSHLPLTRTGEVDDQELLALAPLTERALTQWEQYLLRQEGVEQARVVIQDRFTAQTLLHLSDVLPGWGEHARTQEKPASDLAQQKHFPAAPNVPLSISAGATLRLNQDILTLPQVLLRAARQQKSEARLISLLPDGSELIWTYQQLFTEAQRVLSGLQQLGLGPGERVIMQVEWCHEFLPVLWGCLLGGIVPVPVSIAPTYEQPTSASNRLHHAWQMLGQPIVVAGSNLASSLQTLARHEQWTNFQVVSCGTLQASATLGETYDESQPGDVALILLTSGSTGLAKGVNLTHQNLLSMVQGMIQQFEFTSQNDVTFNWMPLDHVGGIVMLHLRALYLVSTQVHALPQTILQDPLRWFDYLDRYRATITWTANFALGLINERAKEIQQSSWDLSSLRYLINGGEAIAGKVARNFLRLLQQHGLSQTAMCPAWGMSETSSGVVFSRRFSSERSDDADQLVEVGEPIPGFSVRLVDEHDQVVEEGQVGRMQVRGPSVTSGYYQNREATQEAFTADGWFDTGDLGLMRAGQLTITGRAKDTIIINGINYYSQEIEAAVEELEEVETSYTAACAVREGESATDQLAIFVVSRVEDARLLDMLRKVRARVNAQVGITPAYVLPVSREAIPKTSIGKIQRSQLKKEFEAGTYRDLLKELDLLLGNANTLLGWFYRKCWQPRTLGTHEIQNREGVILVLIDEEGVGAALCEQLRQRQQRCIRVERGAGFERLGDDHYQLEPSHVEEYHLLNAALLAEQIAVKHVVHLWGYHPKSAENAQGDHLKEERMRGLLSVLYLVQALEPQWQQGEKQQPNKLVVVSNQLAAVGADEEVAYEKAPVVGLLKTFAQELSWLQCIHIDLPWENTEQNARGIFHDLYQNQEDPEVAYRGGQRFVARLELIDWAKEPSQPLALHQKGFYLLSGGLGGVGYELACHLLQEYQARVLLIGRTPLVLNQDEGASSSSQETLVTRLATLQELTQYGGAVRYEAVDVCDLAGVRRVVSQAQQQWECLLDGVFHLAGTFHEQELLSETAQQIEEVLRPKVEGAWSLHQLLKDRPGALFVSFSSVNAFFGGRGVGAYASASSFLESFAHYQRVHCGLQSYCLAWSMWDEVGMSQGYHLKGFSRMNGYQAITPQSGWYSLLTVLHRAPGSILVGLDGTNQRIRRYLVGPSYALQEMVAYLSPHLPRSAQQGWPSEWGALPGNYRLVQLATIPLKETGEIDIERLGRGDHRRKQGAEQEPHNKLEQQLLEIWREVLNAPQIGVLDNFFELGGHSLLATQVIARLQRVFQLNLQVRVIFEHPTIADLAQMLEKEQGQSSTPPPLVAVARDQRLPLSFAQQRLWFLDQLEPGTTAYIIPLAVTLQGPLVLQAFTESLTQVCARHETLRTTFSQQEGDPWQRIAPPTTVDFPLIDLQALAPDQRTIVARGLGEQERQRAFDLSRGPLLRSWLLRVAAQEHVLLLTMHHIVCDGWSMGILVRELTQLYQDRLAGQPSSLPALPIQYADYASWQRTWLQGEVLAEQLRYWTRQLSQATALQVPGDFPRAPGQSQRGAQYACAMEAELADGLRRLSQQEGVTLFMTLLAAWQVLLARLSGQQDLVIGTDSANRSRLETEGLIGFFVNVLALRVNLQDQPSFQQLLQRVREMVLGAYAHQELPFEMLVEHLRLPREGRRTPLINVLFVMQNVPLSEADFPDLLIRPFEPEIEHAKFDLACFVSESSEGLSCSVNYSTDLFKEVTIAKILNSYEIVLRDILAHPDLPVNSLEIQSATEKAEGERIKQQGIVARKSKLKKIDRNGIQLD